MRSKNKRLTIYQCCDLFMNISPKIIYLLSLVIVGCDSETCNINFDENAELYREVVAEVQKLNLGMDNNTPAFEIIGTFTKSKNVLPGEVFNQVEFIECHADGTIIFQAPNCDPGNMLRDVVNFVAFSPRGIGHIRTKRNIGELEVLDGNWYAGTHIHSMAN